MLVCINAQEMVYKKTAMYYRILDLMLWIVKTKTELNMVNAKFFYAPILFYFIASLLASHLFAINLANEQYL